MSKKQILVVEDDPDDQYLIKEALIPFQGNFDLQFFEDGQELLDHLKKSAQKLPNLIILDLNLPYLSGQEVLTELKSNPRTKDVPVVVFTTSSSKEDEDFCEQMGVSDFATKPGTFPDFQIAVQMIIRKWVFEENDLVNPSASLF